MSNESQPSSAPNPRESAAKSKRGGRRPGAGAPKGNLNGLKPCPGRSRRDGLHSKQLARLGLAFASPPQASRGAVCLNIISGIFRNLKHRFYQTNLICQLAFSPTPLLPPALAPPYHRWRYGSARC